MRKNPAVFALAVLLSTTGAVQAQTYLCIADHATGFSFNKTTKAWQSTKFSVEGHRYLLKQNGKAWVWSQFGETYEQPCDDQFDYKGFLSCKGMERFSFNRESLRFQIVYPVGYVHAPTVPDDAEDTPFIEIGRCSVM